MLKFVDDRLSFVEKEKDKTHINKFRKKVASSADKTLQT